VKSVTIEVTPAEAQKLALAQTFGQLQVALRATGDESRVPIPVATAIEMFGMRPPPKQTSGAPAAPGGQPTAAPRANPFPGGAEVRVVRGTETSVYQVPR
jgi:Flp pilus assembly protein CpaB